MTLIPPNTVDLDRQAKAHAKALIGKLVRSEIVVKNYSNGLHMWNREETFELVVKDEAGTVMDVTIKTSKRV